MAGKAVMTMIKINVWLRFYFSYVLTCLAFPNCKAAQFFPSSVLDLTLDQSTCDQVLNNVLSTLNAMRVPV